MLLTVPFALVGIFRYQLLSDPEEAERRRLLAPERTSENRRRSSLGTGVSSSLCWPGCSPWWWWASAIVQICCQTEGSSYEGVSSRGAGLVGLNLIALLQSSHPDWELLAVDKKQEAVAIARKLFPKVTFLLEDLTRTEGQRGQLRSGGQACVMLQAEIGNTDPSQFERNNVRSTEASAAPTGCIQRLCT